MLGWFRRWSRAGVKRQEFSDNQRQVLDYQVPRWQSLPETRRSQYQAIVQVMLSEQSFEGCDGLEVSDEMRLTVCGNAALMLLGVNDYYFDGVTSILLYPQSFRRRRQGRYSMEEVQNAGEAWQYGPIILSWADCDVHSPLRKHGRNVIVHEFAHHLDGIDGEMGGSVQMPNKTLQDEWDQTVQAELHQLQMAVAHHHSTFLDPYGAESQAEFFAVLSEAFFEEPAELKVQHPKLFELTAHYYQINPVDWTAVSSV